MSRLIDVVAPRRLGRDFRWLLPSSWVGDLGDGIVLAAGPLLVASQTRDPLLIAAATVLQRLPWMLFGLYAGVLADRLDRRALVVWVDVARAVVLGVLAATIATGRLSVWIVLVSMFVLGTAETFVDTTTSTLLPMVVDASDLGVANARLMVGRITINRLAGPPLGALLFAAGMTVPFVAQAVLVALGAVLISRIGASRPIRPTEVVSVRTDVIEGLRWVWAHPPIRTLTITILSFNITFGAAWSILVLYALERLGLSDLGFGLLTA
ncbi:MAG: MFS transporter, partial [Ilumatobacteraceae bacterium]